MPLLRGFVAGSWLQALRPGWKTGYQISPRNQEWFAGCQFDHTITFPITRYELFRTLALAIVGSAFLPFALLAPLATGGTVLALAHHAFERRLAGGERPNSERLMLLRMLIVGKSAFWGGTFAVCIILAPEPFRIPVGMIATLALVTQGLKLIAIPHTGMLSTSIMTASIAGTFFWLGGVPNIFAGLFALLALNAVHSGLFHLHHMFATRQLRTRELKEKSETIQLLLNQYDEEGSDWLFETDGEGRFLNPSDRFCQAAGLARAKLAGMRFSDLMEPSPERDSYRDLVLAGQPVRNLAVPVHVGGKRRWWSLSARPVADQGGQPIAWRGFVADITQTREAEEKVAFLAHYDSLTGLPNRNLFGMTLDHALGRRAQGEHIAVFHIDLSQFKEVNEMHGHEIGDHVLVDTALALKSSVPQGATVARLGGDEFAVLIEHLRDPQAALRTARAIGNTLRQPVTIDGQQFQIGARIGIALAPENGETVTDMMRCVNHALHDAKTKGRNAIAIFDPAMKERVQDRRRLERDLRKALVRGELEVHYQALVAADTGRAVGYEALLRWNHPERGMISPSVFVPIAEETGQIIPIGAWVMREALMEASTWPEDIFISINLSPVQMKDPKLVSTIFMALSASGVSPSRVEFEITESVLLTDNEENLALLHKIRDLGVKIVMDDFGTGYSSLSYLRSFPFDKIKIDRCFVTDLAEKTDSQAIVSAVIRLAEELGMCTLAEGVENIEQLERLRNTGCEQVQGFLFSRARPGSELEHKRQGLSAVPPQATVTPFIKGEVDRGILDQQVEGQRAAG